MFCMSLSVQWMCWTVCTGSCATVVNAFDACVVFGMWLSSSCTGVTWTLQTDSLSTQRQIGCCYTGRFDGHRVTSPFYWQSFMELFWNLEGHRVAAVCPLVAVFSNQHEKEMSATKTYSKDCQQKLSALSLKQFIYEPLVLYIINCFFFSCYLCGFGMVIIVALVRNVKQVKLSMTVKNCHLAATQLLRVQQSWAVSKPLDSRAF